MSFPCEARDLNSRTSAKCHEYRQRLRLSYASVDADDARVTAEVNYIAHMYCLAPRQDREEQSFCYIVRARHLSFVCVIAVIVMSKAHTHP